MTLNKKACLKTFKQAFVFFYHKIIIPAQEI